MEGRGKEWVKGGRVSERRGRNDRYNQPVALHVHKYIMHKTMQRWIYNIAFASRCDR